MNYYISDYHFYHQLTIIRSRGQFSDLSQMHQTIIKRHNALVTANDDVYILGDVLVCPLADLKNNLLETLKQLNGHLHLIVGNHDHPFLNEEAFINCFASIDASLIIQDQGRWVHLSHYPLVDWYRKHKNGYHLYGHLHNQQNTKETLWLAQEARAFNVCVEIQDYTPKTLSQLIDSYTIER